MPLFKIDFIGRVPIVRKFHVLTGLSVLVFFILIPEFLKAGVKEYLHPQATIIVISDNPDPLEQRASLLLCKWLRNLYRVDSGFAIIKSNRLKYSKEDIFISIGRSHLDSLFFAKKINEQQPYSFLIKKENNIVNICGTTPLGTLIATAYFLDRFCGIRFYLPDDLFVSMPEIRKVRLSNNFFIYLKPFTQYVMSTGFKTALETNWAQLNGLARKDWGVHQHTMGDRFYDDSIFKLYPEIFPLINGKKYFPQSKQDQKWEPDFAEPKLVDAAVYSAIKYFKKNPKIDYISFSVQDSRNYPTEGKMGIFLKNYPNTPEGKYRGYTDAYISFLNKLAKRLQAELPKNGISTPKTIVYIVYGNVRDLPVEKLDTNILPVTVFHISETLMDSAYNLGWQPSRAWYRLNAWPPIAKRIGNDDWAEGRGFIYPRIYTNLVSRFLRTIQANGQQFDYAHLEFYPNWALDGPKYYFMGKIYWNPSVNTDSLLNLFCKDMFGKAAAAMKKYFMALENLNTSMNNDPKRNRRLGNYITQLSLNSYELLKVNEAAKSLDEAGSVTLTDDQKKRIAFFSKGFRISESFFEIYNSKTIDFKKINECKEFLKNEVVGDQMMLSIATEKDFLQKMDTLLEEIVSKRSEITE